MSETAIEVAYAARNKALQVERDQVAHEDLCAVRYENINNTIAEIKGMLKWGGMTAFGVIIAMLGFLLVQYLGANDQARRDQQLKIEMLQDQLREQHAPPR